MKAIFVIGCALLFSATPNLLAAEYSEDSPESDSKITAPADLSGVLKTNKKDTKGFKLDQKTLRNMAQSEPLTSSAAPISAGSGAITPTPELHNSVDEESLRRMVILITIKGLSPVTQVFSTQTI